MLDLWLKNDLLKELDLGQPFLYGMISGYQPNSQGHHLVKVTINLELIVDQLIDHITRVWNEDLLRDLVDPTDYTVIRGMPIGSANKVDSLG